MCSSGYVNGVRVAYLLTCFMAIGHFLVNDYHFLFGNQKNKYECMDEMAKSPARTGAACEGF